MTHPTRGSEKGIAPLVNVAPVVKSAALRLYSAMRPHTAAFPGIEPRERKLAADAETWGRTGPQRAMGPRTSMYAPAAMRR